MADEGDPNASGPSDSADSVIIPQGAEPVGDEPPQKDGLVAEY